MFCILNGWFRVINLWDFLFCFLRLLVHLGYRSVHQFPSFNSNFQSTSPSYVRWISAQIFRLNHFPTLFFGRCHLFQGRRNLGARLAAKRFFSLSLNCFILLQGFLWVKMIILINPNILQLLSIFGYLLLTRTTLITAALLFIILLFVILLTIFTIFIFLTIFISI